jgi:hypothetical protein
MRNPQCISTVDRMLALLARLPRSFVTWRALGWLVAALVATVLMARTPLFGVLGYELGLAMAAFGSLCGLDLGAAWIRRVRAAGPAPLGPTLAGAVAAPVAIVAVPLVLLAVRGLWVRVCDPWFGLEAYLALALASTALAAASGAAVALLAGPRRWLARLAPWLALIALIVIGVRRFRGEPPVFTYSPLVGFFPGNLYDEDIRLDRGPGVGAARAARDRSSAALAAMAARSTGPRLGVRWRGGGLGVGDAAVGAIGGAGAARSGLRSARPAQLGYAIDRRGHRGGARRHGPPHAALRDPLRRRGAAIRRRDRPDRGRRTSSAWAQVCADGSASTRPRRSARSTRSTSRPPIARPG